MGSTSPTPPKGSVRSIISIFENQTIPVDNEPVYLIRRAKSTGSLSQKPTVIRKTVERIEPEPEINLELAQIEQQVRHLQNNLSNNYRTYSRESHVYYQNQIIFVLTDLGNVETKNNPRTIDEKSELTEELKRLNKKLNALLPSGETSVLTTKREKFAVRQKSEVSDDDVGTIVTTAKYDRFGKKSRSFEEKHEVKINRPEAIAQKYEERVVVQQEEDDVDAVPVSVRNLKEMFESNTNEKEGKTEFGQTKISRKYMTFNGTSDLKYVPYSQKYKKSALDSEFRGRESIGKQNFDLNGRVEIEETTFSYKVQPNSDDEEKRGEMSPDSFNGSGNNSSSEGSDSEKTAKEFLDDE